MIRKECEWFTKEMERRLKENDHKLGWIDDSEVWHFGRLENKIEDLHTSLLNVELWGQADKLTEREIKCVIDDTADIANRVMMIADVVKKKLKN